MGYRQPWYGFVINTLREYHRLKADYDLLKEQSTTPSYSGMAVSHSGVSRKTEESALRELSPAQQKRMEAVEDAMRGADDITKLIVDMVYFKRSHTLRGAADRVSVSYRTARRRQRKLFYAIAKNLGID